MGVKAWKAKIVVADPGLRAALDFTFRQWNHWAERACIAVMGLRRGDYGEEGRAVWRFLSEKGTYGTSILDKITLVTGRGIKNDEERAVASDFLNRHGLFEPLCAARDALGPNFWYQFQRAIRERIESHEAKLQQWHADHAEWIERRREWEEEHRAYMKVRPVIEAFEAAEGQSGRRRGRWRRWLDFLSSHPELAAWRGGPATIVPLSNEELAACRRRRRRAVAEQARLFFEKNPELRALDREHDEYQEKFARPWAKRRNPDGFRHRPTFTLPHPDSHPDWPRFKGNAGWRDLSVPDRTVSLELLCPDGSRRWFNVRFVPDPRLASLRPATQPVRQGNTTYHYVSDAIGVTEQPVQPQGIKLILRPDGAFLSVSVSVLAPPCGFDVRQSAIEKYGSIWACRKYKQDHPDRPLVTCAVDLAVRHNGALTVARDGEVFARRLLHNRFFLPGDDRERAMNIPSLLEIAVVKRQLRRARRQTGHIAPGKPSCARLQAHYRALCEDRYKKLVAAIFGYARHHGAEVVIFEDLKNLLPNAVNERGVNRALQSWNRGAIVRFARQSAEDVGLRVAIVPAPHTSIVCARCGALGCRFEQTREGVRIAKLGPWFGCRACGRRIHADLNASENLHKVLIGTFPEVRRISRDPPVLSVAGVMVDQREADRLAAAWLGGLSVGPTPF